MNNYEWIKDRRKFLGLSQEELAFRLHDNGFDVTRATVSHWEKGRYRPPFDDPIFTDAIAKSLDMDVRSVLVNLGYHLERNETGAAARAAAIIEALPSERQEIAIHLLETLLREN